MLGGGESEEGGVEGKGREGRREGEERRKGGFHWAAWSSVITL